MKKYVRCSEELHKYSMLVCGGEDAASRGADVPTFYEVNVRAASWPEALKKAWKRITGYTTSEYFDGDPDDDEILEAVDNMEPGSGDPWIAGATEDGEEIIETVDGEDVASDAFEIKPSVSKRWFGYDLNDSIED